MNGLFTGTSWILLALVITSEIGFAQSNPDAKIDRELLGILTEDEDATAPMFIVFGDRANLKSAYRIRDWNARGNYVVQALRATADRSQAGARAYLRTQGIEFTSFFSENQIYVRRGSLELARAMARRPEVAAVIREVIYKLPDPPSTQSISPQGVGGNIGLINADDVWLTKGIRGEGIVVANIDTGVQHTHPALVSQYRGNTGSGFSHAGNFYDPSAICSAGKTTPCDNNGHGTHTMGTMVGDDGAGNQIGVAPKAQWIACKGCESNSCSSFALNTCADWILAPAGNTALRPHVVNNSWGGGGGDTWYQGKVQAWVAAGIFPQFSNGNSGPSCSTAGSPGDYPESFAAGATDSINNIALFSSRGPSKLNSQLIKPDASAPGVSIRSSYPTDTYASMSGTSMASPHVAGTVALMWSGACTEGAIATAKQILKDTALDRTTTQTCGGIPAGASPNNTYGSGIIDALAAVNACGGPVNQPPSVTITSPANGSQHNCGSAVNFSGTASDPEDGNLSGSIQWLEGAAQFDFGPTASKTFSCTETGPHTITAKVADSGGLEDTDTISITIVDPSVPGAPVLSRTISGQTVNLSWTDVANETRYEVEKKPKKGTWTWLKNTGENVTATSDSPGTGNWSYRVRGCNASNCGAFSNVVSANIRN